jgi:hypothetical protein
VGEVWSAIKGTWVSGWVREWLGRWINFGWNVGEEVAFWVLVTPVVAKDGTRDWGISLTKKALKGRNSLERVTEARPRGGVLAKNWAKLEVFA